MTNALPPPIEQLFARYPALCGFCVVGAEDVPDDCQRSGEAGELFVGDIGLSGRLAPAQYEEVLQQIVVAIAEVVSEKPQAGETLRGRTFARMLQ